MGKFLLAAGAVLAAATWFLLFVILGIDLGTAFIAGGCVLAGFVIAAGMASLGPIRTATITSVPLREVLDAQVTASGVLLGVMAFIVLEVVLSVPMWIGVVTGLSVTGLSGISGAVVGPRRAAALATEAGQKDGGTTGSAATNGRDTYRHEPALTH